VLGYLVDKAYGDGDLDGAIELALESAGVARRIGWAWWEAGQRHVAASLERERGNLGAAEEHARAALELSLNLGDRRRLMLAAGELAALASTRGDGEQAGRLWGAIESEHASRPVRQWENRRGELEALVLRLDGPAFSSARAEGTLMSSGEAAGLAPAG
jgi:hypothetical protein